MDLLHMYDFVIFCIGHLENTVSLNYVFSKCLHISLHTYNTHTYMHTHTFFNITTDFIRTLYWEAVIMADTNFTQC